MLNNTAFDLTASRSVNPRTLRRIATLPCALAVLLFAGCSTSPVCSNVDEPYLQAKAVPPLKVPAGMDAPNRNAALVVPPPPAQPAPARGGVVRREDQCLDSAPSYFGTALSPLSSPEEVVAMWAQAWSERNTERMMAAYSQRFEAPADTSSNAWLEQRREQVATGPVPTATVQGMKVTQPAEDRRVIAFAQRFDNNTIRRELTLVRENGFWRILSERVVDLR